MGKKSFKKRSPCPTNAPVTMPSTGSWEFIDPLEVQGSSCLHDMVAKIENGFNKPESGTWRVAIRRANIWMETKLLKQKKNSPAPDFRAWWISFIFVTQGSMRMVSGWVHDEKAVSKDPRIHKMTPPLFFAALLNAIKKVKSRPTKLIFWPGDRGSFRFHSVHSLVDKLQPLLSSLQFESLKGMDNPRENLPDSCNVSFVFTADDKVDAEVEFFLQVSSTLDENLQKTELRSTRLQGRNEVFTSITDKRKVTQLDLRRLYKAARMFHDARPWEFLTNHNVLYVTVPDIFGIEKNVEEITPRSTKQRTFIAVIIGNGSWYGRGFALLDTWEDVLTMTSDFPARPSFHYNCLQFRTRTMEAFRSLDHIEELAMEVSSSGATKDDAYPVYFHTKKHVSSLPPQEIIRTYDNPPSEKDLPCIALATMAIAKFATNPDYCWKMTKSDPHPCVDDPVQIDLDLIDEGWPVESFIATVQHRFNSGGRMLSPDEMEDTTTEGGRDCNFCQKPKTVMKKEGKLLKKCTRCEAIYYCSKQCQRNDWVRHKKYCRPVEPKFKK